MARRYFQSRKLRFEQPPQALQNKQPRGKTTGNRKLKITTEFCKSVLSIIIIDSNKCHAAILRRQRIVLIY